MSKQNRFFPAFAAMVFILAGATAAAASTPITATVTTAPSFGTIVAATTGASTMRLSSSGTVTTYSGGASALPSWEREPGLVTITCGGDTNCTTNKTTNVKVSVSSTGSPTGRAQALTNFTIAMNTATLKSGPTGTNPVTFTIGPLGATGSASFYLGMDMGIVGDDTGGTPGTSTASFAVGAGWTSPNVTTTSGAASANVMKSLTISSSSDLSFGTVVRPATMAGNITISQDNGQYYNSAGIIPIPSSTPSRAVFNFTGHPNTTVSIQYNNGNSNLTLTNAGGATLIANLQANNGSSATLDSTGSFSFGIGGSVYITPTTPYGTYSGVLTLTASYN